jgi:hypothetical protein
MSEKPIVILGAGATAACGGPLTDQILPAALNGKMAHDDQKTLVADREELLGLTRQFLGDCFNVPLQRPEVTKDDCPSLPMVLSMLRQSVARKRPMGNWEGERLVKAKRAIEYAAFAVIEAALRSVPRDNPHRNLLEPLYLRGVEPVVVSLNYDVIVDNEMFALNERYRGKFLPDEQRLEVPPPKYCVDIATDRYKKFLTAGSFGRLMKIHGSLNWLYCDLCQRLDLFISEGMRTGKALDELYHSVPFNDAYSCRGTPCRNQPRCKGFISPILITPTFIKDYENRHIEQVWQQAENAMKEADRAVIVGYSLPTDDVEVALLFKNGLGHLPPNRITVVEYVSDDLTKPKADRTRLGDHATGQRFRTLFGDAIDWHTTGFQGWLNEQNAAHGFPFSQN